MANYHNLKNAAILTPTTNQDLGSDSNRYSNVFMSGNIVMSNGVTVTSTNVITPKISSLTLPDDDTAVATAGGQTVTITGSGFSNTGGTPSVLIGATVASSVTYNSATSITFTTPPLGAGVYVLYVINIDGGVGIFVAGINYSGTPNWSTASGSLGSAGSATSVSLSVTATGDAPITYALAAGSSLPAGLSLNSSTGAITGTMPTFANATTYNFTINANDLQNQTTARAFSITGIVSPTIEYLVVAGGGGGGGHAGGGGGGAGGLLASSVITPNGTTYTVTVGAGGVGGDGGGINTSAKGSNSLISAVATAIGGGLGGGGGYTDSGSAGLGGSGGGGRGASGSGAGNQNGGAGTTSQGYAGGDGSNVIIAGGGGGGANAIGGTATNSIAGSGGAGLNWQSLGTFYGGGGGGGVHKNGFSSGTGGTGGGGAGAPYGDSNGIAGTINTGGGGGGCGGRFGQNPANGGAGGSGVVIIRYEDSFPLAVSTTGSPIITTAGGYRIYKYNSSGSITF